MTLRRSHLRLLPLWLSIALMLPVPIRGQDPLDSIPQPTIWVEGQAGPWGPGNPFYELRPPGRKKLLGYLNTRPSTLAQLDSALGGSFADIEGDLVALVEAHMLRAIDSLDGAAVYAPTFAILSLADLDMLSPLLMKAAEAYATELDRNRDQLDGVLADAGMDAQYRLPIVMAFFVDQLQFEYMDRHQLYPTVDGICPRNGRGNLYGYEPYNAHLSMMVPFTQSMARTYNFLYLYPRFRSDSLFRDWGYSLVYQASKPFARILGSVGRKRWVPERKIVQALRGEAVQPNVPAMLEYLVRQRVLEQSGEGYRDATVLLDSRTLAALEALCEPALEGFAALVGSEELAVYLKRTAAYRNGVSLPEIREVVAWQTVWLVPGFLGARDFFPEPTADSGELFVFRRSLWTVLRTHIF